MTFAGFLLASLIAQTPNPATVDGTVTNKVTGQPIKKAKVVLNLAPGSSATTDAAGHFQFNSVTQKVSAISAECPGYVARVKLLPGQQNQDIAIQLMPLATASGRVLDEDGEPMRFVQVVAVRSTYLRNRKHFQQSAASVTDDLGRFQIMDLQPGKYFFEASPANRPPLPERTISTIPE